MATLRIRIHEDSGEKEQEIVVKYNGKMLPGLAKHFCYPEMIEQNGTQVANPQSALDYLAQRIVGDLAGLAMQGDRQIAEEAARRKIKQQMEAAAAVSIVVSAVVEDTMPMVR